MIDDRHVDERQAEGRNRERELDGRGDALAEARYLARGNARIAEHANSKAKEYGLLG
jgi:hypothetical protein